MDELSRVVLAMNQNLPLVRIGLVGKFYQACFEIIKDYLLVVIQLFFNGKDMPKYMTRACLILLPKVDHPNKHKDFRPIILSNFSNKVISKIISTRIALILPSLISVNKSCFVKVGSILKILFYIKRSFIVLNSVIKEILWSLN